MWFPDADNCANAVAPEGETIEERRCGDENTLREIRNTVLCAAIDNEAEPEREDDKISTVIDTLGAAPTGEPKAPPRHSYPLRYASALLLVTALLG
ncbi:hypothetical protein [Rhodococcus sp. IEGM 1379]|uniref:hypothetical protein n=1 Tax=Rhodococcus sp. IEGM 1379 TaxID=3047086 RepID=UPI0024B6A003|nr:hypothetical protein [Rhodococcus sp. IEGM 1379]MDI9919229.1 hypothetical protein [Rhodococcus sp. IEGM 1379]